MFYATLSSTPILKSIAAGTVARPGPLTDDDTYEDDDSEIGPVGSARSGYSLPSDSESDTTSPRRCLYVRRNNPYSLTLPPHSPVANRPPIMPGVAHQPLIGRCDFIFWPNLNSLPTPPQTPGRQDHWVSLSQLKFELTPAQVRWVVWRLAGVVARRVVSTGAGTFRAAFKTFGEAIKALKASKRALFDHHGMWVPSHSQLRDFNAYHTSPEFRMRSQRLPREFMRVSNIAAHSRSGSSLSPSELGSPATPLAGMSSGPEPGSAMTSFSLPPTW